MASDKEVEAYVRRATKALEAPSHDEVREYLEQVPSDSLRAYWERLRTDLSWRATNSVPDWQSKTKEAAFLDASTRYRFVPPSVGDVDAALRDHVADVVVTYINEERQKRAEFLTKPWYVRFHTYWAMAIVTVAFAAPVLLLLYFPLHAWLPARLLTVSGKQVELVLSLVWGAFLVAGIAIHAWVRWRRRSHEH